MQLGWFWNELSKIAADFAQYKHAEPGRRGEPENENGLDFEGDAYTDKICCVILLSEWNMNPSAYYENEIHIINTMCPLQKESLQNNSSEYKDTC